jgi:tRNA threonylcarbamoyladenosine biosynthesis protein TsaB
MQQASLILPMLQQILADASLSLNQLDMIAYGCGPGSFTGIRIACAVAQGLGFAYSLPIMPISSLAALAQAAWMEHQWPQLLVAVDARMGEVYWSVYTKQLGTDYVDLIGQEHLYKPESVIIPSNIELNSANWYGLGDAWLPYKSQMLAVLGIEPCAFSTEQQPTADAILRLAKRKLEQGGSGIQATEAIPIYLR